MTEFPPLSTASDQSAQPAPRRLPTAPAPGAAAVRASDPACRPRWARKRLAPASLLLAALLLASLLLAASAATDSARGETLEQALGKPLLDGPTTLREVQAFCEQRVRRMPPLSDRESWEREAERLRRDVLDKVVFRGQAATWRTARCRVEWLGEIEGGPEYRIRKLRYEALPDLWIPALLYEPRKLSGQVPVVLNVNGHDGKGKAAEYKQIRCINQAKRGMLALNVEWFGMGQLRGEGFGHYRMNQLDLCGTSGLAPFYLAMQRALNLLLDLPHADPGRVAVAGLSGGGWQTIFISSLDTRVTLANPVAGYSSYLTRIHYQSDLGDSEQTPVDLAATADYTHLTAMLAPRPALLTFNAQDNCCFASPHALPPLREAAAPVYELYGQRDRLREHVNHDPGTHNFERDNRQALYAMFRDFFFGGRESDCPADEIECAGELKTAEQLQVALPEQNLDFHQLAVRLAAPLPRGEQIPQEAEAAGRWRQQARQRLRDVVRFPAYTVRAEPAGTATTDAAQVTYWKLKLNSVWTLSAVEFVPPTVSGTTLLVGDSGRAGLTESVSRALAQGRRVVALDPFYFGDAKIQGRDFLYALLVSGVGERPLGIQAGQLAAVGHWLRDARGSREITIESVGRRTSLMALVAAAAEPDVFDAARMHGSLASLKQLIHDNGSVDQTPELFCFGLLAELDIRHLAAAAWPMRIDWQEPNPELSGELARLPAWFHGDRPGRSPAP